MATEKDEMDLLLSEKERKIGDKKVVVKKISLLNTIRLASHLSEIAGRVVQNSELAASAITKLTFSEGENEQQVNGVRLMGIVELLGIIGEDGSDLVVDLITKSTNLTEEEAEEIDTDSGIELLFDIYEVNKGFFTKLSNKLQKKVKKPRAKSTEKTKQ
jgi:hypothetical protein